MPFARSTIRARRRRSAAEVAVFAEAWLALGAAALKLKAMPFEKVMRIACSRPLPSWTQSSSRVSVSLICLRRGTIETSWVPGRAEVS